MNVTGIEIGGESSITLSEEAKKIYREAEIVAEQRMKEKFPELPSLLSTSKESSRETNKKSSRV